MWVWNYTSLGYSYHKLGLYAKENKLYRKAQQDFHDDPDLLYRQAILALSAGKIKDADGYKEKYISISRENSASEAVIAASLAGIYASSGINDKAEEYYRKALSLQSEDPISLNNFAYFLINKDRNNTEGLELIDKALKLSPDNYLLLDTKGWGLYKQGKYQEALDFIQKSWDLKPIYNHEIYLHLQEVKKAVANQKNN
jgi:Tfp pilus assembly protein PilF